MILWIKCTIMPLTSIPNIQLLYTLLNGVDLTGKQQHGFIKNRSTSRLFSKLLSQISWALDNEDKVLIISLDLSSALDRVNINLLINWLRIIGFPGDSVEIIKVRLSNWLFYVSIDVKNSIPFDLLLGTVQDPILWPVLSFILFLLCLKLPTWMHLLMIHSSHGGTEANQSWSLAWKSQ